MTIEVQSIDKHDRRRIHICVESSDKEVLLSVMRLPAIENALSLATDDVWTDTTSLEVLNAGEMVVHAPPSKRVDLEVTIPGGPKKARDLIFVNSVHAPLSKKLLECIYIWPMERLRPGLARCLWGKNDMGPKYGVIRTCVRKRRINDTCQFGQSGVDQSRVRICLFGNMFEAIACMTVISLASAAGCGTYCPHQPVGTVTVVELPSCRASTVGAIDRLKLTATCEGPLTCW